MSVNLVASTYFDSRVGLVVANVFFAGVIGLIGLAIYRTRARSATFAARIIVLGLIFAAMLFSITIVTWDWVDRTATSTESFIIVYACVPLWMTVEIVVFIDSVVVWWHRRERHRI